jgi:transposase
MSSAYYDTLSCFSYTSRALPDWAAINIELAKKGLTKQLLWQEYQAEHGANALGYTQFCAHYRTWKGQQRRSMRQTHKAGEKLFIDFCGPTVPIVNPTTGEVRQAAIFVACMGASNYTYSAPNLRRQSKKMLSKLEHVWNAIRETKEETNWLPTPCY